MKPSDDVVTVKTIDTRTHGRYLVRRPGTSGASPVLMGFHGYGENADVHLEALLRIPDIEPWLIVSVQALHPFYTKREQIVASWMTRQDRELAIADNVAYVGRVLAAVHAEYPTRKPLVFAGFSQGGATAYRAAAHHRADGLIVLASDVPPDVAAGTPMALPHVLIGRGSRDDWYTGEKHAADVAILEGRAASVTSCVFDGGHEWTSEYCAAAGQMLAELDTARSR